MNQKAVGGGKNREGFGEWQEEANVAEKEELYDEQKELGFDSAEKRRNLRISLKHKIGKQLFFPAW